MKKAEYLNPYFAGILLGLMVLVLCTVAGLRGTDDNSVRVPILGVTLPSLCVWRLTTGFDCPGCGLSRCLISMAHGDVRRAWHFHPAGVALFFVVLIQLPYRGIQLHRSVRGRSEIWHPAFLGLPWAILAVFFVQWLLKTCGMRFW